MTPLNLRVPFELSRAAARAMAAAGTGGSIVHVGSLNNAIGVQGVSVYGAPGTPWDTEREPADDDA
jgi:NAD(P)-dependent dehydrogenase (short-subunit alcohol dehydrogenase family)